MLDRSDEFSEMVAQFTRQVRNMPYEAMKITIFEEMKSDDQMEAYIAGVLIGMMVAISEQVKTIETMHSFEEYILKCVPRARHIAEEWKKTSTS